MDGVVRGDVVQSRLNQRAEHLIVAELTVAGPSLTLGDRLIILVSAAERQGQRSRAIRKPAGGQQSLGIPGFVGEEALEKAALIQPAAGELALGADIPVPAGSDEIAEVVLALEMHPEIGSGQDVPAGSLKVSVVIVVDAVVVRSASIEGIDGAIAIDSGRQERANADLVGSLDEWRQRRDQLVGADQFIADSGQDERAFQEAHRHGSIGACTAVGHDLAMPSRGAPGDRTGPDRQVDVRSGQPPGIADRTQYLPLEHARLSARIDGILDPLWDRARRKVEDRAVAAGMPYGDEVTGAARPSFSGRSAVEVVDHPAVRYGENLRTERDIEVPGVVQYPGMAECTAHALCNAHEAQREVERQLRVDHSFPPPGVQRTSPMPLPVRPS